MEFKKAFDYIVGKVEEELVKQNYTKQKVVAENDNELVSLFTSATLAYSVVYYKDKEEVLFPKEMIVAMPLREGSQYRTYKYASYINDDSIHSIKNGSDTGVYDYFFMYDGEELFFFPTEVTLSIDSKEYRTLSGASYVSVVGNNTLVYYDYKSEESEVIEIEGKLVEVTSEYIKVNLTERYFMSFNDRVLLSRPYNLPVLYKTN